MVTSVINLVLLEAPCLNLRNKELDDAFFEGEVNVGEGDALRKEAAENFFNPGDETGEGYDKGGLGMR
jgi:hypothetical protein